MEATFQAKRDSQREVRLETYTTMRGVFGFHSTVEILRVKSGSARVWINDIETVLRAGEFAIVLSNVPHRFLSLETGEYSCLFVPDFLCPAFIDEVRHRKVTFPILRDAVAVGRIEAAFDALGAKDINALERTGYVHLVLGTVLRYIELDVADEVREMPLSSRLFAYINEHYREELSVEHLAQTLGYSRSYLSETFRAVFHTGIGDYINTLRLKNAVVLMREQNKTVTECALESGFGSLRTFYRVFSEAFGCTPKEYMRREGM